MYINPFIAGVLITIIAELVIVIAGSLVVTANKKNRK